MTTQRIRFFIDHNEKSYEVLFAVQIGTTYIFYKDVEVFKADFVTDNRQSAEMVLRAYFLAIENTIAGERGAGK